MYLDYLKSATICPANLVSNITTSTLIPFYLFNTPTSNKNISCLKIFCSFTVINYCYCSQLQTEATNIATYLHTPSFYISSLTLKFTFTFTHFHTLQISCLKSFATWVSTPAPPNATSAGQHPEMSTLPTTRTYLQHSTVFIMIPPTETSTALCSSS